MESAKLQKEGILDAVSDENVENSLITATSVEDDSAQLRRDPILFAAANSTTTAAAVAQGALRAQPSSPNEESKQEDFLPMQPQSSGNGGSGSAQKVLEKKPMSALELLLFKEMVGLVFSGDLDALVVLMSKHPPDVIEKLLNKRDEDGASLLFVAVKLAHKKPALYQKMVEVMINYGANPRRPDKDLWTCMHEAIQQLDKQLALAILSGVQMQQDKHRPRLLKLKDEFDATLETLPDFSFELCYGVDSSFIPLINRMTPSDRIRITKYKKHVRFESTFAGYDGLSIIRRDIKSIYNPQFRAGDYGCQLPPLMRQVALYVGDNLKKYTFPVHPLTPDEQEEYIERWIKRQQKKKEKGKEDRWRSLRIHEISFAESKGFFGGLKQEQLFGFDTQKFDLKLVYDFISMERQSQLFNTDFGAYWTQNESFFQLEDVSLIDRINYDKYNKENVLNELLQDINNEVGQYQSKALKLKEKDTKRSTLGIWITKNYPLKFRDLKLLIKTMMNQLESDSQAEVLKHLDVLLQDRNLTNFMDLESAFPVKLQVPLGYSLYADITFQNFKVVAPMTDDEVQAFFSVPAEYEHIERLKMAKELGIGDEKKKKNKKKNEAQASAAADK